MADRISNRVSHKIILILFLITSFFELLLSTLQFLFKHSLQGLFYFFGERYFSLSTPDIAKASLNGVEILRPYGTFSHPNSLAGFFLLLYFFILTFKPFEKYPVLKYATLLISGLLIFLSFSKIPITIFLVLNTWYVVRNPLALKCTFCKTSRVFVILVLSILFISSQGDPFTITKRISLVGNALTIFFQHPFFGVGMGNYLIAQNQFPIHYSYFFLQPVHNIFLLYLCESGIFLFAFTLYTLVQVFKKLWGNQTFQYMLVIVGVTGMFDHYWLTLQQNLLLFPLLLALL